MNKTIFIRSMNLFMSVVFFKRIHIFLGFLILSLFFFNCATVSHSSAFNPYALKYVPPADKRHYVLMKDSSIVYGEKVVGWNLGIASRKLLHIDGKPIHASEVLGFQNKEGFWTKLEYDAVARRMITGRISVYRRFVDMSKGSYAIMYFQKAGGPVREISGREELKQMLSDCPKAYDMLNIPNEEYAKIVKKQPYFLQSVIEAYNNCSEWQ